MPPHWVGDLWTYWQWLDRQVTTSGGFLANRSYLEPDAFYESDDPEDTEPRILEVRDHVLIFHDGYFLKFTIVANASLELIFYEYHYAAIGGRPMIWRACKNSHRVEQLDSESHVHIGRDDVLVASQEVDLDDAIRAAHDRTHPGIPPD